MSGGGQRAWASVLAAAPSWEPPARPTIAVVPHPDDESLSMGGLLALQRRRGLPVTVVAVTDGEAAHGEPDADLGLLRRDEQDSALRTLGVVDDHVVRLGLPDGAVGDHVRALADRMGDMVGPDDLLVATSRDDVHPDHVACGLAAAEVAAERGCSLLGSLFWALQWRGPEHLETARLRRLELPTDVQAARRRAVARHVSQTTPLLVDDPVVRSDHLWVLDEPTEHHLLERAAA